MNYRAEVLGPWYRETLTDEGGNQYTVEAAGGARCARVVVDYPCLETSDTSSQPSAEIVPARHLVTTQVLCRGAVLLQIEADPRYKVLAVDGTYPLNGALTQGEYDRLHTWLEARGLTVGQVEAVIGDGLGDRTRWDIIRIIRAYCRQLRKAA